MLTLIFVCLILCYIGYILNEEIHFLEFLGCCLITIVISLIIYGLCLLPVQNDYYFQSGRIKQVQFHPHFVEEYEQRHEEHYPCGKDEDGDTKYCTRVYYTTEHATHYEYWSFKDTLGQEREISQKYYNIIAKDFGNNTKRYYHGRDTRCTHGGEAISGDNALYYVNNETNTYNYPTNSMSKWYNPIKRTQSIFNTEKDTLKYPGRIDIFTTNRDMTGKFKKKWDILNTRLYERIGVNVILTTTKEDIKDYWMKGRKNDVIIQVDNIEKPTLVNVFGWYKTERLSSELSTYILDNGINLKGIEHVILSYYEPFDFSKFDYLKFQVADWQIILVSIITILVLVFTYVSFSINDLRR